MECGIEARRIVVEAEERRNLDTAAVRVIRSLVVLRIVAEAGIVVEVGIAALAACPFCRR